MFRAISYVAAVAMMAAALVTCRDATGPDPDARARAIQVNSPPESGVLVGDTFRLRAVVSDARGNAVDSARVVFRSDDPEVAAVDSTGVVTAVSAGTANVSAWSGELTASVRVTVVWGDLGSFRLENSDGVIHASRWSVLPVYVHFTARNGVDGASVCGRVPLSFRSDSSIAYVEYAPLPGDPCTLRIVARGAGSTLLTVSGPGLNVSPARIEVTDDRYWVGLERLGAAPSSSAVAGSRVAYRVTVLDENGRRAAGVELWFEGTDGQVLESPAVTDTAGTATVHWQLPVSGNTATFRSAVADGSHAQASIRLKPRVTCRGVMERLSGPHAGDTVFTGTTLRYRLTLRDDTGQPVWGLPATFFTYNGTVSSGATYTDSVGTATVDWTLPVVHELWPPKTALVGLFARWEPGSPWPLEGGLTSVYGQLRHRYRRVMEREDGGSFAEPLLVGSKIAVRLGLLDDGTGLPVSGLRLDLAGAPGNILSPSTLISDGSGEVRFMWTVPTIIPSYGVATFSLGGTWPDGERVDDGYIMAQALKPDRPAMIVPVTFECNESPRSHNWSCYWLAAGNHWVRGDTLFSGSAGVVADLGVVMVDQYGNQTGVTSPITFTAEQANSIRSAPSVPSGGWGQPATVVEGTNVGLAPGFSSQWITISYQGVPSRRVLVRR